MSTVSMLARAYGAILVSYIIMEGVVILWEGYPNIILGWLFRSRNFFLLGCIIIMSLGL